MYRKTPKKILKALEKKGITLEHVKTKYAEITNSGRYKAKESFAQIPKFFEIMKTEISKLSKLNKDIKIAKIENKPQKAIKLINEKKDLENKFCLTEMGNTIQVKFKLVDSDALNYYTAFMNIIVLHRNRKLIQPTKLNVFLKEMNKELYNLRSENNFGKDNKIIIDFILKKSQKYGLLFKLEDKSQLN